MPWPLAVLCWLDNRMHDHAHGPGLACKAHDKVMIAWWKMLPRGESKFNKDHLGAS